DRTTNNEQQTMWYVAVFSWQISVSSSQNKSGHSCSPRTTSHVPRNTSHQSSPLYWYLRELVPQLAKTFPCRLATLERQQGFQLALDELPIETGTTARDNGLHIGPVAIPIREHFHHDQVFGATSQQ